MLVALILQDPAYDAIDNYLLTLILTKRIFLCHMTTVQVPYTCGKCKTQFNVTMKLGEPFTSRPCTRCGGTASAPPIA
jgi:hypothetical protein